ncbi:MAG: hypothetical protein KH842_10255 [Firmicutes bacterium]|nr:hypothetical protein [Bacillota bacterium]
MGRIPDLPCDIEQVVDLLGIEVIRDTGTQLHCRCPFCADRKAHMNVKIRDNVFRCNRCGKGGGILHLYAEYCDVNLHTAYEELCKIFGPDGGEPVRKCKRKPPSLIIDSMPNTSIRFERARAKIRGDGAAMLSNDTHNTFETDCYRAVGAWLHS